ncbi:hypothetical protein GF318_00445 [Candidatus Micrarchaeota archaeon]|nr:hypothetical protein [Candidatus Micrarchaeota archaeon]
MCELCDKAKSIPEYQALLEKMVKEDKQRMEFSKEAAKELRPVSESCFSSVKWPVNLIYPMFEARAAYAVPNNYFQQLRVGGRRMGNAFAHGAMRSVFFVRDQLFLFSKGVNFKKGKEFFTSFVLLNLKKGEYQAGEKGTKIVIRANAEKPVKNLITGKVEKKKIAFAFQHHNVEGRIVSKERVADSARFREVYDKYKGGARMKSASMDLEGYAVTVHHLSPHPYLLQLCSKFGYEDNKDFQLHVKDYLLEHIK